MSLVLPRAETGPQTNISFKISITPSRSNEYHMKTNCMIVLAPWIPRVTRASGIVGLWFSGRESASHAEDASQVQSPASSAKNYQLVDSVKDLHQIQESHFQREQKHRL